jgi:hypothetical protein
VVCENLQPRSDDKHHEDDVEQMLPAQPARKSRIDRRRKACRRPRITVDETLHPLVLAQLLSQRDRQQQSGHTDRQQPQQVEPASANPNRRRLSLFLLRQSSGPLIEIDASIPYALARMLVKQGLKTGARNRIATVVRYSVSHCVPLSRSSPRPGDLPPEPTQRHQ